MIVFIDNKQNISSEFRPPRYYLFSMVLIKENYKTECIFGSWHHQIKRRKSENYDNVSFINNLSYNSHIGLRRLFSELLFGFQVLFKKYKLIKNAKLIVLNDSGILYNYIFYFIKPFFNYKILLDSNDLWPEIFFKSELLKKLSYFIKSLIYKNSNYLIAVNTEYLEYYKYLKHKNCGVIYLGLSNDETRKLECNLYDKDSNRLLYLGSLGANYMIDELIDFVIKNKKWSIDFYGSGDKRDIIFNALNLSNGRIRLFNPTSLEEIKIKNIKYSYGIALYDKRSLVKFPTKLFDYWMFSLPVIVNVGNEVEKMLNNNSDLGFFLKDSLSQKDISNHQSTTKNNFSELDLSIDTDVKSLFKKII